MWTPHGSTSFSLGLMTATCFQFWRGNLMLQTAELIALSCYQPVGSCDLPLGAQNNLDLLKSLQDIWMKLELWSD